LVPVTRAHPNGSLIVKLPIPFCDDASTFTSAGIRQRDWPSEGREFDEIHGEKPSSILDENHKS